MCLDFTVFTYLWHSTNRPTWNKKITWKNKWQEKLKSRLQITCQASSFLTNSQPTSLKRAQKWCKNPPTLQKGDAIAMAGSTAARTGLQLKLLKSSLQIFFYHDCISKVSWSHQLIQRLCLKGRRKVHLFPSSRWCEHCWAWWERSQTGKWRPCGTGSKFSNSIALNLANNKAAKYGIHREILPMLYNTKAVARA